eukprot:987985-Prymnesium_polylepis.1
MGRRAAQEGLGSKIYKSDGRWPMADGRWWRPGTVSGTTRALRCLWHEVRVGEKTTQSAPPPG